LVFFNTGHPAITHPLLLAGTGIFLVAHALTAMESVRRESDGEAGKALLEAPDDPGVWPVEVEIVQEGVVTGVDRGLIWFEDRALGFSGEATSFLVTHGEVVSWHTMRGSQAFAPVPTADHRLILWTPPQAREASRQIELRLRHLRYAGFESFRFEEQLRKLGTPRTLLGTALSPPRGQFPPLDIGPGAPSLGRLTWEARGLFFGCALASIGAFAIFEPLIGRGNLLVAAFAAWGSMKLLGVEKRFEQAQFLRRLRSRERARETLGPG
jgi:hypothetical protein